MTPQQKVMMWANNMQEMMFAAQIFMYQVEALETKPMTAEMPRLKNEVSKLKSNIPLIVANLRNIREFLISASPQAAKEIDAELSSEQLKDISTHLTFVKKLKHLEKVTALLEKSSVLAQEIEVERIPESTC